MPNSLESPSGPENPSQLKTVPTSEARLKFAREAIEGPSLQDLEAEARLLWEEDPELAAALGIELTAMAVVQKNNGATKKTRAEEKPEPVQKPETIKKKPGRKKSSVKKR